MQTQNKFCILPMTLFEMLTRLLLADLDKVSLLLNESSWKGCRWMLYIIPPMPPIPPIPPMPPMAGAAGVSSLISVTTASAVVNREATPLASVKALRTTQKKHRLQGNQLYSQDMNSSAIYWDVTLWLMCRNRLLRRDTEIYIKFVRSRV